MFFSLKFVGKIPVSRKLKENSQKWFDPRIFPHDAPPLFPFVTEKLRDLVDFVLISQFLGLESPKNSRNIVIGLVCHVAGSKTSEKVAKTRFFRVLEKKSKKL